MVESITHVPVSVNGLMVFKRNVVESITHVPVSVTGPVVFNTNNTVESSTHLSVSAKGHIALRTCAVTTTVRVRSNSVTAV